MSKNHKPYDERELQQADATAYALGELSAAEAAQFERSQAMGGESSGDAACEMEKARRLGQLLRSDIADDVAGVGSTSGESIRCSTQVREAVLAALDAQETNLPPKLAKSELPVARRNRTRIWAWSLVASIAIVIGGMFWFPSVQSVREVARRTDKTQTAPSSELASLLDSVTKNVPADSLREIRINAESSPLPNGMGEGSSPSRVLRGELADVSNIEIQKEEDSATLSDFAADLNSTRESAPPPQVPAFRLPANASPQASAANSVLDAQSRSNAVPDGGTVLLGTIKRDPSTATKATKKESTDESNMFFSDSSSAGESTEGNESQGKRITDQFGTGDFRAGVELDSADVFGDAGGGGGFQGQKPQEEKESYGYRYEGRRNPANEQYKSVPENPFWRPIGERGMSTFSIDVDTASYANVRRFLNEGSLPPPDAVRLEEFINYFHYDYPQPEEGSPFAVDLKLFGCPWNAQHSLLRVGLHGREIEAEKRPISNIVYLVDVSGSMSDENKLPLLKRGLSMMVDHLSENDTVSIVTYAGDAGVRLEPTNGANKKRILDAIDSLQSGGSTNGAAGIEVAYRLAQQKFVSEGANRVILMTDGDLNVGVTSDEALVSLIKEKAAGGVFLTVLGFGTGNLKDAKLEGLADNGNGIYGYIDSLGEAHKVLVEQMSGNLVTIAKDVKIQIEFNPAQVAGYRLIGYENRVMANQDFADDRKDAGEIGAGHTVTALYEIVPVGAMLGVIDPSSPTLKYQTLEPAPRDGADRSKVEARLTEAAASGELASVALRFKTPEGTESRQVDFTAKAEVTSFSQADSDCRFAAAVAGFGMRLRQSPYAGNITLDAIAEIASAAIGNDPSGHRAEFVDLVRRAKNLQNNAGE